MAVSMEMNKSRVHCSIINRLIPQSQGEKDNEAFKLGNPDLETRFPSRLIINKISVINTLRGSTFIFLKFLEEDHYDSS